MEDLFQVIISSLLIVRNNCHECSNFEQLDKEELRIRETPQQGVQVPDLIEKTVRSIDEFQQFLEIINRAILLQQTRTTHMASIASFLYRIILENVPQRRKPAFPIVIQFAVPHGEI
jgi:hypothetical protein